MTDAFLDWATETLGAADDVQVHQLPVEASYRSFYRLTYRLTSAAGTCVLMVSPPEKEQNRQFEVLAEIFESAGIPVPHILARRPEQGWYLLSDLGSTDLEHAYAGRERDDAIRTAIDCLVRLQMVDDRAIPPYTAERFADELNIFGDWFVGRVLRTTLPGTVEPVFKLLVARAVAQPHCCVHRDYHCRNLLYERGRLGVVDFQDALIGPVSYDLASLLHDCYHEFGDAEVARWTDHYLSRTPLMLEPDTFRKDLEYCAVQRQLKAVGIFARLKLRDGKSSHLPHIAPVLERIHRLARRHGPLAPLATWLGEIDVTPALTALSEATVE
jgi:aminoglycoside/choline kinase family phosphotransferase